MDANFRLKNRLRSNSKADPGLGTGWAYFVPEEAYREHILKYVTQEEVHFIYLSSPAMSFIDREFISVADQHLFRILGPLERQSKELPGPPFHRSWSMCVRAPHVLAGNRYG